MDAPAAAPATDAPGGEGADARVRELEQALQRARHDLQQTVEQAEAWSVELGRSNERLHATVGELRTHIEELENNREALQSRNEELHTVNAELQARAEETAKANDDLSNLIASTDIATLFLDGALCIQRYTPHATRIFNIIPADVGRPLADITNRLDAGSLFDDVGAVFASQEPAERELRSSDGSEYIVRIHPYRTAYDRVEGVVMTFFDITRRRSAEQALEESARRHAFLLALSDALRAEARADGMAELAIRMLAAEMGLDRCCIAHSWLDDDRAQVVHQTGNGNVPPLPATFRPSSYPAALRAAHGATLAIDDDSGQPDMRALVVATLRGGENRPAWSLAALCAAPRRWTHGEVTLVEEVAERVWNAIERARVEALALRAERRAESILEHMGDAHSVLDRDFVIVGVNAAAERLLGRDRATLLGRSHWDAFPGSVDAPVGQALRRVVEEGIEQHLSHHYTGEGYDLYLEVDVYPTEDGGLAMFWRDVTERAHAELALRASEERYRTLFNEMDEAYAVVEVIADAEGRWTDFLYLEVNPAFMRHTGMPYPVGRTANDLLGTPNPRWAELYGRAAQTGEAIRLEEGEMTLGRVFDLNIFRLGGAGSRQVAVLFNDITARKQTEDALRESEARFRALAEASPALIWQVDAGNALSYVNGRCLEVTGASLDTLRGLGWHGVVHPDDAAGYLDAVAWALREQAGVQGRVRLRQRDGSHHWFASHALPWHAADGSFRGLVGMSIDVDEAVRAEEALKVADRRKDEFLATLAHELRNPLAPISNALQFLRHPNGKRSADRLLAMVERQVRLMVRLVDDLMEVSRISRGKVDLQRAPVALAEILHCAVETSLPGFEQKRQQLTVDAIDASLRLDADKVRLTQVFANLLNNAARYTPPEGRIWLGVHLDGRDAVVTVRDTGIGIAREQLPLIFEMFSQPHGRNGHTDSGLGIGLAMVRSLVLLHDGAVEARSEGPGQGSEFVVRLPLADCPEAAACEDAAAAENGAAPLAGRRILVVDDNRDAADSLCQLLAARGAETRAVYGGRAALEAVEATRPHAVVLDIGMPEMDGYEVARQVRQDGRAAGIRLVALSGWGQFADRERSAASGFDHHLTKPAEMESLLRILAA